MNSGNLNYGDPELLPDAGYRKLLGSLADRYPLETIVVDFGETPFYFTRVRDPGNIDLDLDRDGQLKWQPYWADDWESSRAICRALLKLQLADRVVLDLGCGLGLTGAVAAQRGARVVLVDNAEPALEFSRLNCWRWLNQCQFRSIDWKKDTAALPAFDWIVGAEIIYDPEDWWDLNRFWQRHLAADGSVLLCDPFRRSGRDFRDWIKERGWNAEFSDLEIPEFERPVNLIKLRWPTDMPS